MSLGVELYVVELRFRFGGDLTYEGVVDVHVSSVGDLLLNAVDLGIRSVEVDGRPVDYSYDGRVLRVRGVPLVVLLGFCLMVGLVIGCWVFIGLRIGTAT
ncbi:hypothetical protein [Vulcanisaeta souniana]|uniref:hypothetical protein n=1 Tax=Vulcanisaeta souniana TaxID=164452 RepID=UPI000A663A92|nr:hypothetical protein [Vulcanisaeta souniana]